MLFPGRSPTLKGDGATSPFDCPEFPPEGLPHSLPFFLVAASNILGGRGGYALGSGQQQVLVRELTMLGWAGLGGEWLDQSPLGCLAVGDGGATFGELPSSSPSHLLSFSQHVSRSLGLES